MTKVEECVFCGNEANVNVYPKEKFFECDCCGRFSLGMDSYYYFSRSGALICDKVASFMYYNNKLLHSDRDPFYYFMGSQLQFDAIDKQKYKCKLLTIEEVKAWYPTTFSAKVDLVLIGFSRLSKFDGDVIEFLDERIDSALFVKKHNEDGAVSDIDKKRQFRFLIEYISDQKLIQYTTNRVQILPDGYKRIDELQRNKVQNTNNVFVAMSFDKEMVEVREAIKSALMDKEVGYVPILMDEIEHNHQIVPEMLHEIKKSKFVIAELTGHNNGAYFEAGYALGLGKEVIQICKADKFGTDGHFDVKQINTVLWKDIDDLKFKLKRRIIASIGK